MGSNNGVCGVDPLTNSGADEHGVFVESIQGECGGFYADGDVAIIVSSGNPDLLRVYDEDDALGRARFTVDGRGDIRVGTGYDWMRPDDKRDGCCRHLRLRRAPQTRRATHGQRARSRRQSPADALSVARAEFPTRGIGDGEDIGLIAQDVEKVMPEMVVQDSEGFRAVHYERLPMLLLQSVRELKSENDTLKRLLTEQEARLRALETASVRQPQ